ncbi:MAG: oxalate/formate MFS antiporter [Alphaproteobacteria bacterium]|nr:oxalate/formate MFS antiporter [Alphaproteobacteria bacterium]
MAAETDVSGRETVVSASARWIQLALGIVCMMAISSPQYVWALFSKPLGAALAASPAALQVTFSLLIVLQTFFSPAQGWLVDRFGPRLLIAVGGGLSGFGWVLAAHAGSLWSLYVSYGIICGLGTGIVYVGVVGQVVRWFPEARGFAAGMVAAGYGMGAILTTFPISASIASAGYQATLQQYGVIFAIVGILAALGLRRPPAAAAAIGGATSEMRGADSTTMLKSPIFWLMFAMMSLMSTSGLMVISQIGNFAADFGITKLTVWGMAALPLALTIDRFTNGLTRPFFGWLSDWIGRENAMFVAFTLEAAAMTIWLLTIRDPLWFALLSGVVFFGWGEIFSLFPSTLTDTFGARNATQNYGCLYIAQGIGSIFGGPLAALLHDGTGSWTAVFAACIAADLTAALLAIFVLKPMRRAAAV